MIPFRFRGITRVAATAALALTLLAPAAAASATTLDDLRLGEVWYGDPVTPDQMKGRVVVVEFWGFN